MLVEGDAINLLRRRAIFSQNKKFAQHLRAESIDPFFGPGPFEVGKNITPRRGRSKRSEIVRKHQRVVRSRRLLMLVEISAPPNRAARRSRLRFSPTRISSAPHSGHRSSSPTFLLSFEESRISGRKTVTRFSAVDRRGADTIAILRYRAIPPR